MATINHDALHRQRDINYNPNRKSSAIFNTVLNSLYLPVASGLAETLALLLSRSPLKTILDGIGNVR